jgi:hypothetical protein
MIRNFGKMEEKGSGTTHSSAIKCECYIDKARTKKQEATKINGNTKRRVRQAAAGSLTRTRLQEDGEKEPVL